MSKHSDDTEYDSNALVDECGQQSETDNTCGTGLLLDDYSTEFNYILLDNVLPEPNKASNEGTSELECSGYTGESCTAVETCSTSDKTAVEDNTTTDTVPSNSFVAHLEVSNQRELAENETNVNLKQLDEISVDYKLHSRICNSESSEIRVETSTIVMKPSPNILPCPQVWKELEITDVERNMRAEEERSNVDNNLDLCFATCHSPALETETEEMQRLNELNETLITIIDTRVTKDTDDGTAATTLESVECEHDNTVIDETNGIPGLDSKLSISGACDSVEIEQCLGSLSHDFSTKIDIENESVDRGLTKVKTKRMEIVNLSAEFSQFHMYPEMRQLCNDTCATDQRCSNFSNKQDMVHSLRTITKSPPSCHTHPAFIRVKERKLYIDMDLDDDDIEGKRNYGIEEKLTSDKYNKQYVQYLTGDDFTLKYLQENGLENPILFTEKSGLGLRVPSENFKVSDVKACVGSRRTLDVMDVTTQKGMEMTMKEWVKYYETQERERLLNVISLEFSHTKLENYVESPSLVRQVDWVDTAWPQHLKDCQTEATNVIDKMKYPKVQKYCLMSVEGCYTDFHIDFGGTSVWYHLLHGEKVFWLIPPTERNMAMYENWVLSGKQGDAFLADTIGDCCERVNLVAGNTFIIPSGWIHAVYTPKDSLVFGGNFLHNFNIVNQLRSSAVEDKTHVPMKFRYPFYTEISWYVLERYVHCLTGHTYLEKPQLNEEMELNIDSISPELAPNSESKTRVDDDINTPKLVKKVSVSLTRIDGNSSLSPRRKSSSDDDSMSFSQVGLIRQSSSDSTNSACDTDIGKPSVSKSSTSEKSETGRLSDRRPLKKIKYLHLTKYEYEGLAKMVDWLDGLPKTKKNVPSDLLEPETVIHEMKRLLKEHINDDAELAATGEPVLVWTKATKKLIKYKQKVKTAKLMGVAPPSKGRLPGKRAGGSLYRRVRCKKCEPCTRDDCMECNFCKDMKKYGGPGRAKQSCISRQCLRPILPHTAICLVCKMARHMRDDQGESYTNLMECSFCWDVVHPDCLARKLDDVTEEGIINEDVPSSWKCIRCCHDGKEGQLKARVFKGGWRPTPTSSPPPQGYTSEDSATEGKRVTNKPNPDSKKSLSNPASPLSLPSPVSQDNDRDVKPPPIKLEPTTSPDRSPTTVKSSTTPTSPPLSDIKLEENRLSPVVRLSHSIPAAKSVINERGDGHRTMSVNKSELVKRRIPSGPVQTATAIKKRRLSMTSSPKKSPVKKLTKTPKPVITRSGRLVKKSPAVKNRKGPSPELTKRSRREADYDELTSPLYDFDDSSMDCDITSTPLSAKGKGHKLCKKVVHKSSTVALVGKDKVQNPFHHKILPKKFSSAKKKDDNVANPQQEIAKKEFKLVEPKYVIRPAPPSPPKENVYLESGRKHELPMSLWTRIFTYLPPADLARCLSVCRVWNRWCINPDLWKVINLSRRRIIQLHLMGIVRRQPISLVLTSVIMTQKQLAWLVERIPLLKTLILSKCAWATMSGLCSSVCPLLHSLDISWAAGVTEQCFEDLITPPVDRKPAVKPVSRLHRLKYLNLAGTEITDDSLQLINSHISRLEVLDISYCTRVTDDGIRILSDQNSATQESLRVLNVSSCRQLTEVSLYAMKNLRNLHHLNIKGCIKIPAEKCASFTLPGRAFSSRAQFIW